MSVSTAETCKKPNKSKARKKSKNISFEEEIITKSKAQELLKATVQNAKHLGEDNGKTNQENSGKKPFQKLDPHFSLSLNETEEATVTNKTKKQSKHKSKRNKLDKSNINTKTESEVKAELCDAGLKKKKIKLKRTASLINDLEDPILDSSPNKKIKSEILVQNAETELSSNSVESEATQNDQKESIRQRKHKKHLKLLEEKKIKTELAIQQKCLNYLSQWKHSRSTWKFEKLKQIWLQNNSFDSTKIPNEFWDTLLDYFNGAMGQIKKVLIEKAMCIINDLSKNSNEVNVPIMNLETNDEDENVIKLKRARDVVQCLQE